MLQYIKADLYRLRNKTSNYIFWGIIYALFIASAVAFATSNSSIGLTERYFTTVIISLSGFGILLIGGHCYYTVFLDDVSSKNYPNLFSTGITKIQFVSAKIVTFIIQLIGVFLTSGVVFFGFYGMLALFVDSVGFDLDLFYLLLNTAMTVFLGSLGYAAIGSLVVFWKQNSTLSTMVIFFLMTGMFNQIINLLAMIEQLSFLETVAEYTLSSYINNTSQLVMQISMTELPGSFTFMEMFGETWLASIVYLLVGLIISVIILRKVEIKENN